jgi:hypothetical protein
MQQVLPSAYQLNNVFDRQGGLTTFGSGMAQAATMDQNQLHESVGDGVSRSAAVGTVGVSDEALGMGTTADALIMSPLHTNLDEEDFGSLDDALVYGTDISFTLERFLNKEETEDP